MEEERGCGSRGTEYSGGIFSPGRLGGYLEREHHGPAIC